MEHEGDGYINCNLCVQKGHNGLIRLAGRVGNRRRSRNHPKYSLHEISQNTEKSPGDLRKLSNTQTPVNDHLLMLQGKFASRSNIYIYIYIYIHPVSSHSCWMYVRAGRPAFSRPYVGVHKSTSLRVRPCFFSSVLHVWFV